MAEEITLTSKTFQWLYSDADYHLDQAEHFHSLVKASTAQGPLHTDQVALGKARAHSRACIICVIAGTESLCNCIVDRLQEKDTTDIPSEWIPKKQRNRKFEDWPLYLKVRFVPVLCCNSLKPPGTYFEDSDASINELREIVRVRNTMVHGTLVTTRYTVAFGQNNLHTMGGEPPEDFWSLTHFPKDLRSLSYDDANLAYSHVLDLTRRLIAYLNGKVTLIFLRDDVLIHKGQRFAVQRESTFETTPRWCEILLGKIS